MEYQIIELPYCPGCGKEIQDSISICPNCGRSLEPTRAPQPNVAGGYLGKIDVGANAARSLTRYAILFQLAFVFITAIAFFADLLTPSAERLFPFDVLVPVGIILAVLDYLLVTKPLLAGNVGGARIPALGLGIVQLVFGGVIAGILMMIAYGRIGESIRRRDRG